MASLNAFRAKLLVLQAVQQRADAADFASDRRDDAFTLAIGPDRADDAARSCIDSVLGGGRDGEEPDHRRYQEDRSRRDDGPDGRAP